MGIYKRLLRGDYNRTLAYLNAMTYDGTQPIPTPPTPEDEAPSVNAPYEGLISHWSLEDSGRDYYYGVHNAMTRNGTITTDAGKTGNAQVFNNAGSFLIPPAVDLSFGDGAGNDLPFSFSAWIYPTDNVIRVFAAKQSSLVFEYQFFREASGAIGVNLLSTAAIYLSLSTTTTFAINNFHHVVVTYNGNKTAAGIKIYVNGVDRALTNNSVGSYTGMPANTGNFVIGNVSTTGSALGWVGRIEDVTLFPTVLDQSRVDLLYNSGNGVALTSNEVVPLYSESYERGMFILDTRGAYQFGTDGYYLYWSDDSGETWINQTVWGNMFTSPPLPIPVYNKAIDMAKIFDDGTVLFSAGALLWRSTDKLLNINSVTPKKADGVTNYTIHTPSNAIYPGNYFATYLKHEPVYVLGEEMFVWGSYNNFGTLGAAPVNIWATNDKGATVKAIYEFGQNPSFRDNGTAAGGVTGTLLGDSGNAVYTKHVHDCVNRPTTLEWYSCTGDTSTTENHWLRHTYNSGLGTWSTTKLFSSIVDKWFAASMAFEDGGNGSEIYWTADSKLVGNRSIWKTTIANINVSATNLVDLGGGDGTIPATLYVNSSGKMLSALVGNKILISDDFGANYSFLTLEDMNASDLALDDNRIFNTGAKDSRNYLKFTCGGFYFTLRKSVFIKV
jgi:hypothetical protein